MNPKKNKIFLGRVLFDIGRLLYSDFRSTVVDNKVVDFIKNELNITDRDILEQILYTTHEDLENASIPCDSLAYIRYLSDKLSSDVNQIHLKNSIVFQEEIRLQSIFNHLNDNRQDYEYIPQIFKKYKPINFPVPSGKYDISKFNGELQQNLQKILSEISLDTKNINTVLVILEELLTFVPASCNKNSEISLYDHTKLSIAMGICVYLFLQEKRMDNYRQLIFEKDEQLYQEEMFLLYSMDLSGIQKFIYQQYDTKDALKNLRARSCYLEILLENTIEEILEQLGLFRTNLIYSGGGHAYLLLPNTKQVLSVISEKEQEIRKWFCEKFDTDLYLAMGWYPCSANDLRNKESGRYSAIFKGVSQELSKKKRSRYTVTQIQYLNQREISEQERECRICHRSNHLNQENVCNICSGLIALSNGILSKEIFSIISNPEEESIEIGRGQHLIAETESELNKRILERKNYIRSFTKNKTYLDENKPIDDRQNLIKIWMGDYSSGKTISELLDGGVGIRRMGVIRADIDNLGTAFVSGFDAEYQTLSKSSAFSGKLSVFFKYYINHLLEHGTFSLDGTEVHRKATIIYSGGDDLFIIGEWKDIIEFAVDLYQDIKKYTQGTLTISAGIGIYSEKYPISYIADEVGRLEENSKNMEGKDAVTLFDKRYRFHWNIFIEEVLLDKFSTIEKFFENSGERGKNFLYHLLELLKNRTEKINIARIIYFLSRMEPDVKATEEEKKQYKIFSKKIYEWVQSEESSRQLELAIYLYAYLIREREESDDYHKR
ncbi:type III-A CRISPR-associated protein Cas10/Csm1 [Filifactor alocis]